jgi:hypothetical protein
VNPNRVAYQALETERALLKETADRAHWHGDTLPQETPAHPVRRALRRFSRTIASIIGTARSAGRGVPPHTLPEVDREPESLQ